MRRPGLWWVAAVAIVASSCSQTEGTKSSEQPASGVGTGGAGANLDDDEFVRDVALKNMAEVELSRLALDRSPDLGIKSFAQGMIDDHGAAEQRLNRIVSGQSIGWPEHLDEKHRKTVEELTKNEGADFDSEYLEATVEGHQNLAAKLESRLDVQSLAEWKTAAAGRAQSKALPEPEIALRDVPVRPLTSGNELTMKINQWAADIYAVVQKHLDTARRLQTAKDKRSTN